MSNLQSLQFYVLPFPKRMGAGSRAELSEYGFGDLISHFSKKKCPNLPPEICISVTLQGLGLITKILVPEGGAHSIDKIPIFWLEEKNLKNKIYKLFTALVHQPFQPFKAPVRIATPAAFFAALHR